MRLPVALISIALIFAASVFAIDHTIEETLTIQMGPGDQTKSMAVTSVQELNRGGDYQDTLTTASGWIALELPRLTEPALWFLQIECDSCASNLALLRLITGVPDTITVYVKDVWPFYGEPDSSSDYKIIDVEIYNPNPDTTAYGNTATFIYSFYAGE